MVTQQQIDQFNLNQPNDILSHQLKMAKVSQDKYKPGTDQFKLLAKFQSIVLKELKSRRTTKSIEQLDADTLAKQDELESAKQLLKSRKDKS